MKSPLFPAVLLAAALLFLLSPVQSRADDLADLAGTWKPESAEAGGKAIDVPALKDLVVIITGEQYEVLTKDGPDRGTLKLDEAAKPKHMDAHDTEGQDAGKVIRAIYELKADTLRVCYAMNGGERPTTFTTSEDVPFLLVIYRREK